MPRKPHYHVEIRRNGAVYGTFGPYGKRADALADAGSLGGPGLSVAVTACAACKAPGGAPRRNSGKAQDGLNRRLATYRKRVAQIQGQEDLLAAVAYLGKVEEYADLHGLAMPGGLRQLAFDAERDAVAARQRGRAKEIAQLQQDVYREGDVWWRRNAATSHRGIPIQHKAGVARFRDPTTGERISVSQREGGKREAQARIDAALDRAPMRVASNPITRARPNSAIAAVATRVVTEMAMKMGQEQLRAFAGKPREDQIAAVRRLAKFSPPLRLLLRSDANAGHAVDALVRAGNEVIQGRPAR